MELTDAQFEDTVKNSDVPVLVDFWAPWCGPCKMLAPVLEEISTEFADKVKVCKIDTDENRDAAVEYGINAIPTIILFNNGEIAKKWVGLTSKNDIVEELNALAS